MSGRGKGCGGLGAVCTVDRYQDDEDYLQDDDIYEENIQENTETLECTVERLKSLLRLEMEKTQELESKVELLEHNLVKTLERVVERPKKRSKSS